MMFRSPLPDWLMPTDLSQFIRTLEIKNRNGQVIGTKEFVSYEGLLSKAHDDGLSSIATSLLQSPSEENARTAIVKAAVQTTKGCFEAIGDASPDNVPPRIAPHLIRMAETRAKARALRDAVNIGVISFEELDGDSLDANSFDPGSGAPPVRASNGSHAPSRSAPPRSLGAGAGQMTESQRRFLFRLLAGQGLQREAAHERLLELLGVISLAEVTKEMASNLIEELQQTQSRPRGNGTDERGASLQR